MVNTVVTVIDMISDVVRDYRHFHVLKDVNSKFVMSNICLVNCKCSASVSNVVLCSD